MLSSMAVRGSSQGDVMGAVAEAHPAFAARAPVVLALEPDATIYGIILSFLLALFVARVLGQLVAAVAAPLWLPPHRAWFSGLMPYRYLFPTQVLFTAVMGLMTIGVFRAAGIFGTPRQALGHWLVWASYVYVLGMVVRFVRWAALPPERRGVVIPIIFHLVLAAFLFVFGSWHIAADRDVGDPAGPVARVSRR